MKCFYVHTYKHKHDHFNCLRFSVLLIVLSLLTPETKTLLAGFIKANCSLFGGINTL